MASVEKQNRNMLWRVGQLFYTWPLARFYIFFSTKTRFTLSATLVLIYCTLVLMKHLEITILVLFVKKTCFCSQIHCPWMGDVVDSGIGFSYRPASLCDFIPPVRDYEFGYRKQPLDPNFSRWKSGDCNGFFICSFLLMIKAKCVSLGTCVRKAKNTWHNRCLRR